MIMLITGGIYTLNILNKITSLRLERNWTEYQLAEKSGLTQSTISSWYRKNMIPSISSLEKICDAFGITISQFFLDESSNTVLLTEQQIRLLRCASKLDSKQYEALIRFLESL